MTPLEALIKLRKTGQSGFHTCQSKPGEYKVVSEFKTLEEAQAFYTALVECGKAAAGMTPENKEET